MRLYIKAEVIDADTGTVCRVVVGANSRCFVSNNGTAYPPMLIEFHADHDQDRGMENDYVSMDDGE